MFLCSKHVYLYILRGNATTQDEECLWETPDIAKQYHRSNECNITQVLNSTSTNAILILYNGSINKNVILCYISDIILSVLLSFA